MIRHQRTLTWVDVHGDRFELSPVNGVLMRHGPVGLDAPPVDLGTAAQAGEGALLTRKRLAARSVSLPLLIDDHIVLAELLRRLALGGSLEHSWGDNRQVRTLRNVEYVGGLTGNERNSYAEGLPRVIELVALDPLWHGPFNSIALGSPQGDFRWDAPLPWDFPRPWDGAASGISGGQLWDGPQPWDGPQLWDGGAPVTPVLQSRHGVWPTITVRGSASLVRVTHTRTGETLETSNDFNLSEDGEFQVVTRPKDRSVIVNGRIDWAAVTADTTATFHLRSGVQSDKVDANGNPIRDSDGRIIVEQEASDSLAVTVLGSSATTVAEVAWHERWDTP